MRAVETFIPFFFDQAVKITHHSYVLFVKEQRIKTDKFQSLQSTESCIIRRLPRGSEEEQVHSHVFCLFQAPQNS